MSTPDNPDNPDAPDSLENDRRELADLQYLCLHFDPFSSLMTPKIKKLLKRLQITVQDKMPHEITRQLLLKLDWAEQKLGISDKVQTEDFLPAMIDETEIFQDNEMTKEA
jgi:hypothetical protein